MVSDRCSVSRRTAGRMFDKMMDTPENLSHDEDMPMAANGFLETYPNTV